MMVNDWIDNLIIDLKRVNNKIKKEEIKANKVRDEAIEIIDRTKALKLQRQEILNITLGGEDE
jgi:hypothetical protein